MIFLVDEEVMMMSLRAFSFIPKRESNLYMSQIMKLGLVSGYEQMITV